MFDTRSTTTSYSHTGLTAGSTRHYRVSAINSAGTGTASNSESATTEAAPVTKPDAPTGLTATADGQTEIDLSWTAPSDDGGAAITAYRIEVSSDGSNWSDLVSDTGSTSTSYSHTGLTAGSTRHYRVSAINSVGTGPASNSDSAATEAEPVTKPDAPTGLSATADGQTEIDLSWTAPSDDGGTAITGYRIEVSSDGSNWSDLVSDTGSTATSYTHTSLAAGSVRHYRVSSINSAGTGSASNVDIATTDSQPNRAPTAVGTIPAWTSAPTGWDWVDVSSYFSDPDGDDLTYSGESSDSAVAVSDSVLGSRVLISAYALGTARVTVTARDPGGLEATQNISVTVKYPNRRPERVGSIPTQTTYVGQTISVDVSSHFRDPDADSLHYEAETSNSSALTVFMSGSTVSIRGKSAAPLTWVTVTASDPDGLEAVQQIAVGVKDAVTLRLTECFVFDEQHFARFKVTAQISVSSLVVKTYAVDSRNRNRHLMETTRIGGLSAGNAHEELTTRLFPGHLRGYLNSCSVDATWSQG